MSGRALVVGAGGAVGEQAALALAAEGWRVTASMRTHRGDVIERLARAGVSAAFHDIARGDSWTASARDCDAVIFATHLTMTTAALLGAPPLDARLVVFSSNNVAVHPEAKTYQALGEAERALKARYPTAAIVRPTLIYGDPRLPTMPRLLRMARRWPLIPMPGSGRARMQPVYHGDLGRLAAGLAQAQGGGVYAAGGPDVVTMRTLFDTARAISGGRGAVVAIPPLALSIAAPLLSATGVFSYDQAARADHDRLALHQDEIPAPLQPRTEFSAGLARLWAVMNAADG